MCKLNEFCYCGTLKTGTKTVGFISLVTNLWKLSMETFLLNTYILNGSYNLQAGGILNLIQFSFQMSTRLSSQSEGVYISNRQLRERDKRHINSGIIKQLAVIIMKYIFITSSSSWRHPSYCGVCNRACVGRLVSDCFDPQHHLAPGRCLPE